MTSKTHLLLAIAILVSAGRLCSAEKDTSDTPVSSHKADILILKDGRELLGHFDQKTGTMNLISKRSGRKMGSMKIKAEEVKEVKKGTFEIGAQKAAATPAPSVQAGEMLSADLVTLKDGREMVGHYDAAKGMLAMVSKKTGRKMGSMTIKPDEVKEIKKGDVQIVSAGKKQNSSSVPGLNATWITSFTRAKAIAREHNKLILADFTGSDWCGWCIKLDEEVFEKKAFKDWARNRVVLLKVDFPRKTRQDPAEKAANKDLAKQYHITGYPTILILDAKGEKLRKWGYAEGGVQKWVEGLTTALPAIEQLKWETKRTAR